MADDDDMPNDDGLPSARELDALLDLSHRIRHGQAAASELLPSGMLSQALGQHCRAPLPTALPSADETTVSRSAISSFADDSECHKNMPPGVLHQFIKHVLPFSICVSESSKRSLLTAPSPTGQEAGEARALATTEVVGTEGRLLVDHQSGNDPEADRDALPPGETRLHLEKNATSDGGTRYTQSYPESHLTSGRRQPLSFRSPPSMESIKAMRGAYAPTASFREDRGRGQGCMGAPRREFPAIGRGVEEDRTTAGKRKLSFSPMIGRATTSFAARASPRAPSVPTATAAVPSRGHEGPQGNVRLQQQTKKTQNRGHSTGKSRLGGGSREGNGQVCLSWKAARMFRKRMEGAAAANRVSEWDGRDGCW